MTFVRIGGVPHHVVAEGSGPVCVLSAGLGMSWFDWDPVVPHLAPYRTVVRFDRPGHGLSAPVAAPPTAAGEADRIAAVLDALGHRGPAVVVGHSIAGFHAEAFARLHPDRTAGLVLVDSSVEEDPRPARTTAPARALGAVLASAGLPAALGPAVRNLAVRAGTVRRGAPGPDLGPAPVRTDPALVRRVYRTSRVLRGTLLENARYGAVAAELLALREDRPLPPGLPVTVLAAPDGSARWERRQRALARRLGARYETAEPSGHLVMRDRPDQVARAVLDVRSGQEGA
ncbi:MULTISPECIES: alpha/beta fold hydrolase [Streptomyces]|uniref:alpha/beta fold hydrolase n=1 Tax=Streptomyces TaxID=1883 RepID=UPI000789398E|nr:MULTISPECIES: alpha/beta hydrolase [unclassified Streptomyces]AVH97764.1 alpha/beta hydrolase [Streptomyces sp. WAC00288]KYG56358.1 hydrolase [Streptomyces sp. WAC04657]